MPSADESLALLEAGSKKALSALDDPNSSELGKASPALAKYVSESGLSQSDGVRRAQSGIEKLDDLQANVDQLQDDLDSAKADAKKYGTAGVAAAVALALCSGSRSGVPTEVTRACLFGNAVFSSSSQPRVTFF